MLRAGSRSSSSASSCWRSCRCSAATWRACSPNERVVPHARCSGRWSGSSTGCCASTPTVSQGWKAYAGTLLVFSGRVLALALPDPAHADAPPVQPGGLPLGHLGRDLQHRLVVPHEHELAVLRRRDDDDVLQPDGRAGGAELRLRGRRDRGRGRADPRRSPRGATARRGLGNFWQDLTRTILYVLLPLSIDRRARAVSQGVMQTLGTAAAALPWGRSPRRRSSRSSAPTAAGSSTSTPRCRSRTRNGLSNFVEMFAIL